MKKLEVKIKRVYDQPADHDGERILVDRLWPRGLSKERAHVDKWFKEVAPTDHLRKWYGHEPEKFSEFKERYEQELVASKAFSDLLDFLHSYPKATLLFSAKEPELSNATVLAEFVRAHLVP